MAFLNNNSILKLSGKLKKERVPESCNTAKAKIALELSIMGQQSTPQNLTETHMGIITAYHFSRYEEVDKEPYNSSKKAFGFFTCHVLPLFKKIEQEQKCSTLKREV